MSDYQAEREVQEALRVADMTPDERFEWLRDNWGRLQRAGTSALADKMPVENTARCFATIEEKNRFDEKREIELALLIRATAR